MTRTQALHRRRGVIGLLAALAIPGASAESVVGAKGTIVVGQSITLQDGRNAYGAAVLEGVQLRLDEVNAAGGVSGRRIVLRTLDDDNDVGKAAANARRLVEQGAFVLFGSVEGGPSTAVAKVAEELQVPFFGPIAGSPTLRRPHQQMVFPVRAEHRDEFRALLTWGQRVGLKTVGFFHADTEVGRLHLENVRLAAAELGLQVVLPLSFKTDIDDAQIETLAASIVRTQPDMMFNHGTVGAYAKLIASARRQQAKTNFMAVNSGASQMIELLGPQAGGMVFAQVVPSPWERKREITREYQDAARRIKPTAEFSYGALEGYATAKALELVLRASGQDLTRANLVKTIQTSRIDLGGLKAQWSAGEHTGSRFVDLAIVGKEGRFVH